MKKIRPSILSRSIRTPSKAHLENIDAEFSKEKTSMAARRERYMASVNERRRNLYTTPEEKKEIIKDATEYMQRERLHRQMLAKEKWETAQREFERIEARLQMGEDAEDWEQAARHSYLRHLMEENKKLAQYRQSLQSHRRATQHEEERKAPNFYERWGRNAI